MVQHWGRDKDDSIPFSIALTNSDNAFSSHHWHSYFATNYGKSSVVLHSIPHTHAPPFSQGGSSTPMP